MRGRWITAVVAAIVLAMPGAARAGGWATVELSSTPDGVRAGQDWVVDLTVRQHGRTPLAGVTPRVTITDRRGRDAREFAARPGERTGVYRARVVFPSAGSWDYTVDDGFGRVHAYPPVSIAPPAGAQAAPARRLPAVAGNGGFPTGEVAAAVLAGLAAAGLTGALQRRRGRRPVAPASPPAPTGG